MVERTPARVLVVAGAGTPIARLPTLPRYQLELEAEPEAAVAALQRGEYAAVLLEMNRPDEERWRLLDRLQVARPDAPVLVFSDQEDEGEAIRALRDGAQDYLATAGLGGEELSRAVRFSLERQRMARERQAALERLRELERFKTQFINTAAHELNSPLTPVKLQLHLLRAVQSGGLNDKQAASLAIIDRNVDRLVGLVADILDAARLQAGRLLVRKQPLDLHRLAEDVVESSLEAARRAGLTLELRSSPGLALEADPDRIQQVLFNLVNNAIKFTPKGGKVTVATERQDGFVQVRVQDTGVGLRREDFAKLFQPFSQAHAWTAGRRAGSGLGLYISQGIVEQHEGRIWVDSAGLNRGATFSVALPAAPAARLETATSGRGRSAARRHALWPILYFHCPTCGSRDIDMRILKNKYECRACTDEWR